MPRESALRPSPDDAGARETGTPPRAGAQQRSEGSVGVLGKAIRLLDALAGMREGSTADLAEALGEPRSSVHRLLTGLVELDIVEPGPRRGTYRLGLKLLSLGSAVASRLDVRIAALPLMEEIHDETGETVFLLLRRGREAVCIERLDGNRAAVMDLKLGGSLPLHEGAGPRAFLAFGPRADWDAYLDGSSLYDSQTSTVLAREQLVASFEAARRTGAVINDDVFPPGFAAIGCPIKDHRGEVCAALSISGTGAGILGTDRDRVLNLLVGAAAQISRSLGYDRTELVTQSQ